MLRPIAGLVVCAALLAAPAPATADDRAICFELTHAEAVAACTRLLESAGPDGRADILFERAKALGHKNEFDRALADYDEVIRLDPKHDAAYNNRANIHDDRGNRDAALADYDAAIRLDPGNDLAYSNRCGTLSDKGEADRAIADCTEAIRLNPKSRDAHQNRGAAWHLKGHHDRALADYDQALALDPAYARAHAGRGFVLSIKRDYPRAIAAYDTAIRHDSRNSTAYYGRARAHLYSDAAAKALPDLRRAAALEPDDLYLALWIDLVTRRTGKPGTLARTSTKAGDSTRWPAPVVALFLGRTTLDAMFAAVDDPDPFQRTSNVCDAQFYGGLWSQQQGDRTEAARMLRLAVEICPQNVVEWDAARVELKQLGETR